VIYFEATKKRGSRVPFRDRQSSKKEKSEDALLFPGRGGRGTSTKPRKRKGGKKKGKEVKTRGAALSKEGGKKEGAHGV